MMFLQLQYETTQPCTDLTADLRRWLTQTGAREGIVAICLPHTTAGLGITSFWDPRGIQDLFHEWERDIPARLGYHQECAPQTAAARTKSVLSGPALTLMVHNGRPMLGSSQGVCLLEYDGPRTRTVWLQFVACGMELFRYTLTTMHLGAHDVSAQVRQAVQQSGVQNGFCHVAVPHSTAGLAVCRPQDQAMVNAELERLVPTRADFLHTETPWDAAGHVKTVFAGSQQTFAVENGSVRFGTDLAPSFLEFDGPRKRRLWVGVFAKEQIL